MVMIYDDFGDDDDDDDDFDDGDDFVDSWGIVSCNLFISYCQLACLCMFLSMFIKSKCVKVAYVFDCC